MHYVCIYIPFYYPIRNLHISIKRQSMCCITLGIWSEHRNQHCAPGVKTPYLVHCWCQSSAHYQWGHEGWLVCIHVELWYTSIKNSCFYVWIDHTVMSLKRIHCTKFRAGYLDPWKLNEINMHKNLVYHSMVDHMNHNSTDTGRIASYHNVLSVHSYVHM